MEQVTFVLPTIGSTDMSKDDQGALLVNQATAIIVSAWLNHAQWAGNQLVQGGVSVYESGQYSDDPHEYRITKSELVSLINDVQTALSSF